MNCINCQKKYTRKTSYDKHLVLCDFINTNKRGRRLIIEEDGDIPTYNQLVTIVQELSLKYSKLETKLDEMQKWGDNKKKKIDIVAWLNSNAPNIEYDEWYKHINVTIESSFEHNIIQIFLEILQENLITNQKQKLHYVWEKSLLWSGANFVTYMIYQRRSLYVEEKTVLNLEGILLLMEMKD